MELITFGYDINLGLPDDFSTAINCKVVPYQDINQLIAAFNDQEIDTIFAPAGTLPYLHAYRIIAQSQFGQELKLTLQTNLVTSENIIIPDIMQHSIGRVNKACTTSFWAPTIFLMDLLPKNTLLNFQDTASFPDMLFKTATGKIGSSMVWDIIMEQHPKASGKTHRLGTKSDLPSPLIYANYHLSEELKEKICHFSSLDTKSFFQGFCAPDFEIINKFTQDMQKAMDHFEIISKIYQPA